jgi:hypothetical protein
MGLDMRIARAIAGVAIVAAVSAGCSSTGSTEAGKALPSSVRQVSADTRRSDAHELAHLVRSTISYDYQPSKSPNALIGNSDLAVLGRVTSIEEGRVEGDPDDAPTHFVVIGLSPEKVYKAPSREETYYFEIPRPDNFTAADYRERLPLGTRLVFIGVTAKPWYQPVQNNFAGRPEGAALYAPAPEGLFGISSSGAIEPVFVTFQDMGPAWQDIHSLSAFEAAAK